MDVNGKLDKNVVVPKTAFLQTKMVSFQHRLNTDEWNGTSRW